MNYENKHVKIQLELIKSFKKLIDNSSYLDTDKAYYIVYMCKMCCLSIDNDYQKGFINEYDRNGLYVEIINFIDSFVR